MWYVLNSFRTQIWISFLDVATQKNIRIWHLKRGEFYSFFWNPSTHFLDTLPAKPKSTRHRIHYNRALWGCHNLFIWMFFEFHIHNLLFLFASCQLFGGKFWILVFSSLWASWRTISLAVLHFLFMCDMFPANLHLSCEYPGELPALKRYI